jgi:hypothetical protein
MELMLDISSKFILDGNCILPLLRPLIVLKSIVLDCELVGCGFDESINGFADAR